MPGGVAAVGAGTGSSTPFHTHPHAHEAVIISGMGVQRLEEPEEALAHPATYFRQPRRAHTIVNQGSEALRFVCLDCYVG